MHLERERWASRGVFIVAAVGAAIGLGNVWRFPYKVYQSGGGAFLIPYFVALFVAGIPLLIMEFGLGQYFQGAAPKALNRIRPSFEGIGWWAIGISALIAIYYCVILAYAWNYLFLSIGKAWGTDPASFYSDLFLKKTAGPHIQGRLCLPIVGGLALSWIAVALSIYKGIGRVGKVVMVTVPLPALLLVIMFFRGITLPGAGEGIALYLNPDFSRLADPHIWLLAFSQVFFSVGLGWGIMIAYASYRSKSAEINNSAFITCLSDVGISFFGGFAVFSALGFLTHGLTGVELAGRMDAIGSGSSLAFIAYPLLINELGSLGSLFGVIFFIMLLTLGIDSAFAMVEAAVAGLTDKWPFPKGKAVIIFCFFGFLLGIPLALGSGSHWIDIIDHWIGDVGLVAVALLQCLAVGWFYDLKELRAFVNSVSEFRIGRWWEWFIRYLIPMCLILTLFFWFKGELSAPFGSSNNPPYPEWTLWVGGWGLTIALIVVSFLLGRTRWKKERK
ncbi:MAG: sodium-dependent transporter [Gemmatimonadota bacterium]|nr:MAG: sodium-dependent transporter [Gemmatimonadota bacterium]